MIEVLKGKFAVAYQATKPPGTAMIEAWIVHQDGWSPCWSHYFATIGHLRNEPGMARADKRFPQATHEFRVDAMDSAREPKADDPKTWCLLSPANVIWQFDSATDEQAAEVCKKLVMECIGMDGHHSGLCLETEGIRVNQHTAKEYWRERLKALLPPGARIE